jgi:Fur family transcriptional regulator, ferric uptake regulator
LVILSRMDPALRDRWLARAKQRVAGSGRHSGATRTAVIELLAREGQCLLDAQRIIDNLRPQRIGSHASVYRILQELYQLGLLNRLDGRDGIARYEIADPHYRHHHFIDEQTGTIRPFHDDLLDQAIRSTAQRLGVDLSGHELVLRGTQWPASPVGDDHLPRRQALAAARPNGDETGWGLRPPSLDSDDHALDHRKHAADGSRPLQDASTGGEP